MGRIREGTLELSYPDTISVRRFDGETHPLSDCMKAVDWLIEEEDRLIFVEIKDPEQAVSEHAQELEAFRTRVQEGQIDMQLVQKYRDSFLYRWAEGDLKDEKWYVVLMTGIEDALLLPLLERLKQKLPSRARTVPSWERTIADKCLVLSLEKWNVLFESHGYILQRISPNR